MNTNRVRIDLSKKPGTIGRVMTEHRDEVLGVKSSDEAERLLRRLFETSRIDTPKSRQILAKLSAGMTYSGTLIYLNNVIMKSQRLGAV